jgi:hypothetical protein
MHTNVAAFIRIPHHQYASVLGPALVAIDGGRLPLRSLSPLRDFKAAVLFAAILATKSQ